MHKLDWNDLQYILAVASSGSLAGAARALNVNHSTVLRRINSFETSQGVRVFDRQRTGYLLTPEGEQLLNAAQSVETVVSNLERRIAGKDLRLEGVIRLTTTDSFLSDLIGPHLVAFQKAYPAIVLHVTVTNHVLSLTKRDADVAIRPSRHKQDPLVGARISDLNCALYAAPAYWAGRENLELNEHDWLGLDDLFAAAPPGRWMRANVPEHRIIFTADTFLAVRQAAEAGLGMVILPCFLGDNSDRLVRTSAIIEQCRNALWILTHKDLVHSARFKTFVDFMIDAVRQDEARLLGTVGSS